MQEEQTNITQENKKIYGRIKGITGNVHLFPFDDIRLAVRRIFHVCT